LLVKVCLYQPDQNTVVLSFSDNGIGIDLQRNKERIFRLYSRFHRDVPGSGIGLYLVNEQMKAQQGKIQVESAPGEGTEFKLFFNLVNQTHGNLAN
jgi:signal transduction histidine kinase